MKCWVYPKHGHEKKIRSPEIPSTMNCQGKRFIIIIIIIILIIIIIIITAVGGRGFGGASRLTAVIRWISGGTPRC